MSNKKLCIIGQGRHGKDTVAEILRDQFGYSFLSSSEASAKIFLFDLLKGEFGYNTWQECFEDRHNHRDRWFTEISKYNTPNKSRLAKAIMEENDIYVGMRCKDELAACMEDGVFDLVIWVDASERVSYREPESSCTVTKEQADLVIDNNGIELELYPYVSAVNKYYLGE
jgi:hypothetical protein